MEDASVHDSGGRADCRGGFVSCFTGRFAQLSLPPTVTVTSPAAAATVSGTAVFTASTSASDSVSFTATGGAGEVASLPGTPDAARTSWTASWDSTAVANGAYSV